MTRATTAMMEAAMNDQIPASKRVPKKGEFFIIQTDIRGGGKGHGLEIVNQDRLRLPGTYIIEPPNGDPNQYPEKPHLVHVPDFGSMPRDLEGLAGLWIVSENLKNVFESVDPEGFAFAACEYTLADGTPGSKRYLCGVTRTLDALDEEASTLKIEVSDDYVNKKHYSYAVDTSLAFKEDIVGSAHIFRTPFSSKVFCDRVLHAAVVSENLTGVWLIDAADC